MQRGEVRWYRFGRPDKRRPVVVLTRGSAIEYLAETTVAPITRTIRGIPSELPLDRRHGLRGRSVAGCDSLQTIPKDVLGPRPVGALSPDELAALDRALRFALGIRA